MLYKRRLNDSTADGYGRPVRPGVALGRGSLGGRERPLVVRVQDL